MYWFTTGHYCSIQWSTFNRVSSAAYSEHIPIVVSYWFITGHYDNIQWSMFNPISSAAYSEHILIVLVYYRTLISICPVGWGCRIHRLYLHRRIRHPQQDHILVVSGDTWCLKTESWCLSSSWPRHRNSHMTCNNPLWLLLG